jgi:putative transposase
MNEQCELRIRRRALRLWIHGESQQAILRQVHRSKGWLSKWRRRYYTEGVDGLRSRSRRPHQCPSATSRRCEQLIVQTRQRLIRAKLGLHGPTAIQRELHNLDRRKPPPSCATIKRVLHRQGLLRTPKAQSRYFPVPTEQLSGIVHACDWTCRYLKAGCKVYAFHTLDLHTRGCHQTLAHDKTLATVRQHFLETWETLGIPDYLQLDNDAVFCGGYKVPRVFGQMVRLCLYLGIEPIFLPVAEPQRNGAVEQLNGLWQRALWKRTHFPTFAACVRSRSLFLHWYLYEYAPPALAGKTPHQAQRTQVCRRLTKRQAAALPDPLPITTGRIHFLRQVASDGTITVLNERWRVGRRRAGKYVWATVHTRQQCLEIWYRASAQRKWQLLKSYPYAIAESIQYRKLKRLAP